MASERSNPGEDVVTLRARITDLERQVQRLRDTPIAGDPVCRALVENSLGLMCIHDLEGTLLFINQAAADSLGYRPEDGLGCNLRDFLAPSVRDLFDGYLQRIRANPVDSGVLRLVARDGTERLWLYRNVKHEDPVAPARILGHAQDITDRVRAEEALKESKLALERAHDVLADRVAERTAELEETNKRLQSEMNERKLLLIREQNAREEAEAANRLKDEFLATLSHELRSPLTAILGWAHVLNLRGVNTADSAKALQIIERNARAQAQLIDDILDVSRIVTGSLRIDPKMVDLRQLIAATTEAIQPTCVEKGVTLTQELGADVLTVSGDANRLEQVVWNLLANAVKFTSQGGQIVVDLRHVGDEAVITVGDTGSGIHPDFLPYVFDRCRQADGSTTRTHGGLGLGLAIVKHLVELHRGRVDAESPGKNLGATFRVFLPLQRSQADRHMTKRLQPTYTLQPFMLKGLLILVVDDEPETRELLSVILKHAGADVRVAASSTHAVEILGQERVDVVVADIAMPKEDGYALLQKVRVKDALEQRMTPTIAVTAYASSDERERALAAGFQEYLTKPLEAMELVNSIASVTQISGQG